LLLNLNICVRYFTQMSRLNRLYAICTWCLQEGQRKFEEGMAALAEAQRLESEQGKRIDTINYQLNLMKMKEKEITDVSTKNI